MASHAIGRNLVVHVNMPMYVRSICVTTCQLTGSSALQPTDVKPFSAPSIHIETRGRHEASGLMPQAEIGRNFALWYLGHSVTLSMLSAV